MNVLTQEVIIPNWLYYAIPRVSVPLGIVSMIHSPWPLTQVAGAALLLYGAVIISVRFVSFCSGPICGK